MKKIILQGLLAGIIATTIIGCNQAIKSTVVNQANAEVDISKIDLAHNFIGYDVLACKTDYLSTRIACCQYVIASKYDKTMYTVLEMYDSISGSISIEKTPMYTPEGTVRMYKGEDLTNEFA